MRRTVMCLIVSLLPLRYAVPQDAGSGPTAGIPAGGKYACPMETHPDESDPLKQGPYFASHAGKCPLCGMELKPLDELPWVQIRLAAQGADVAYTCPDHQHVFSKSTGECPRCARQLMPFKVMYTCPDPKHASVVREAAGNCPHCGRGLAAYRGIWLDESMADANLPPTLGLAEAAAFRCPVHPLVHSNAPGSCTICAEALQSTRAQGTVEKRLVPSDAAYACPMEECRQFSDQPGRCPVCGMGFKPINEVTWAKPLRDPQQPEDHPGYICPMHPEQIKAHKPGICSICRIQLVHAATFPWPTKAPEHVEAQVNYLTEHYLELQSLFASDRTTGVARQARAIVSAGDELLKHIHRSGIPDSEKLRSAGQRLRAAALKIAGKDLEQDRVSFVELSAAFDAVIEVARPSRDRWPKLYIYHCPMSKGDWIQNSEEKRNPYYGFKMPTCGELKDVK